MCAFANKILQVDYGQLFIHFPFKLFIRDFEFNSLWLILEFCSYVKEWNIASHRKKKKIWFEPHDLYCGDN